MERPFEQMTNERLITDFKTVVTDAEALLAETAHQSGEKIAQVRAKAEQSLRVVKDQIAKGQEMLIEGTKTAAKATDVYVHENPWKAISTAAGVALLIGWLMGRR